MNLKIETLHQRLLQVIGTSDLPVGIVYYVLQNVSNEVNDLYQAAVQEDQRKLQEQAEEKTEEIPVSYNKQEEADSSEA